MSLTAGPVPLYHQLAEKLRARIRSGALAAGDPLPTEERLCAEYGISRITVRRALDDLIAQGLILRRRGVGTFVAQPQESGRSVSLVGSLYDALAYPKNIAIQVRQRVERPAEARIAESLQLEPGTPVVELHVMSRVRDLPFASTVFYLPRDIGLRIALDELRAGTPVARLVETLVGESVIRAEQLVEPVSADPALAKLLDIPRRTAVLHVLRTYYTASGRPVETASVRYRPDQYRMRVALLPAQT